MKKFKVSNQYGVIAEPVFASQELGDAWLAEQIATQAIGKPESWLADTLQSPLTDEEKALAIETRQVELTPAIPEQTLEDGTIIPEIPATYTTEYKFGSEFTLEIEDITTVVEQQKINQESQAYLDSTDWMIVRFIETGVPVPAEITAERALARSKIIK